MSARPPFDNSVSKLKIWKNELRTMVRRLVFKDERYRAEFENLKKK